MQEKYRIHTKPMACCENIIEFGCFRITVLTESLIRLEYSTEKKYVDLPSQIVWNRAFPKVIYEVQKVQDTLVIHTPKVKIIGKNNGAAKTDIELIYENQSWHIGEIPKTWKGTIRTLDGVDGKISLEDGVIGKNGMAVLDDSKSYLILENGELQKRKENTKDVYLFAYGLQHKQCLKDYFTLTGHTPLIPRFALGNWWSRYHRYNEEEYITLMDQFAQHHIPLSVAMIDMDWHLVQIDPKYGSGWTGYTWNWELFPDPQLFLQKLHDKALKVSLNVHPAEGVRAFEEPYQEMVDAVGEQLKVDKDREDPILFDVTNPVFLEAYFTYLHTPNEKRGVDFWWIDWQQGETTKLPDLDPLWVLNHYHYLDNQSNEKRPMILSRYAGSGSHRYPIGFSGDSIISWESLSFQPYFTATASNIGYGWWSHDIGGHMLGTYDEELQIRWMQWGVFSPINRMHSSCSEFNHKEPWNYAPDTERIISKYLRLRHQLIPYLYTMNHRAHVKGELLIQPMYYQTPEKEESYQVPNEYYFGTEMICLPITTPIIRHLAMAKVKGWLPQGIFIDWQKGSLYQGDREITFYRGKEEMPVMLRAGAIVVCTDKEEAEKNGVENPEAFEVTVAAGADGTFTLYEDDGESFAYQQGEYVCTDFILDYQKEGIFTIAAGRGDTHLIPQIRQYRVCFLGFQKPDAVVVRIDGDEYETQMEAGTKQNEWIVCVQASVRQKVEIAFWGGMKIARNNIRQLCFAILDRAQIPYVLKEKIYEKLKEGFAVKELKELIADEELYQALAEVYDAQGEY